MNVKENTQEEFENTGEDFEIFGTARLTNYPRGFEQGNIGKDFEYFVTASLKE